MRIVYFKVRGKKFNFPPARLGWVGLRWWGIMYFNFKLFNVGVHISIMYVYAPIEMLIIEISLLFISILH